MDAKKTVNGKKVLEIRTRLGMTQKAFGEAVGLSQSGLNNIENGYLQADGTPRSTSLETCWRIAELGGVSIEWLIDVTEDRRGATALVEEIEKLKASAPTFYANEYLELLLDYARRLTPSEQQMMAMLCRRMAETAQHLSSEAQQAAALVDGMPEHRRAEALAKLRDLANKKEIVELRRQFDYLIQLLKDETGEDWTEKIQQLFHVWLSNGGSKQLLSEDVAKKTIHTSE